MPRRWSEKKCATSVSSASRNYDLANDGKRIAAIMPAETADTQPAQNHVVFLMNFADELRRKVPTGK